MRKIVSSLVGVMLSVMAMAQTPVLSVEGGQIQGVRGEVPGVSIYKGIPYAAPPVGDLRWKKPQPVVPWEGIRQ